MRDDLRVVGKALVIAWMICCTAATLGTAVRIFLLASGFGG
jgi:hypothetical protein